MLQWCWLLLKLLLVAYALLLAHTLLGVSRAQPCRHHTALRSALAREAVASDAVASDAVASDAVASDAVVRRLQRARARQCLQPLWSPGLRVDVWLRVGAGQGGCAEAVPLLKPGRCRHAYASLTCITHSLMYVHTKIIHFI
jgi:hypothetical protein